MADMCKPLWKIAFFILLFTKGKAKSQDTRSSGQIEAKEKVDDPAVWSGYRNFKREDIREIRLAQREFLEEQIKRNPNDVGNIWKAIRSCIPKKPANIKSFTKDDQTVSNEFTGF